MKSFEEFENYMKTTWKSTHDEIILSVDKLVQDANIEDTDELEEFYHRALVEVGCMKILKQYHDWLTKE